MDLDGVDQDVLQMVQVHRVTCYEAWRRQSRVIRLRVGYACSPGGTGAAGTVGRVLDREPPRRGARCRRDPLVLAVLVLALAVLTALVAAGTLTGVDQFSLDHLMPWFRPRPRHASATAGFYVPFGLHTSIWTKLLDLWTYPCSLLISGFVVAYAAVALWRREGPAVALAPAGLWLVGNGIEVIGKHTITRPLLERRDGAAVNVFANSFPSGHMIRGLVVGFALALVWPRATPAVALWLLFVPVALVLSAAHTITDVLGGLLAGLILLLAARLLLGTSRARALSPVARERPRGRASPA
jgi:membrane-associated phospholipid phosphatase